MRARVTVLLAALSFGCGTPSVSDAGAVDAAVEDSAEPLPLCARDPDCDDGLFCTGVDRCRPGEPGADARGCVNTPPPCDVADCDEAADRCGACSDADADRDGDGDRSFACGGMDCDDDDNRRSSDILEICDAADVDEDCTDSTIHGGRGMAGDIDMDDHVSDLCANVIDGAETLRGDDCDDTDPAIYAGAPERCNGEDDDCDGAIDEDYECIQSQVVMGTTACGNPGERECSATCTWVGADFTVAESAATCDYCDDSGMGIGQEVPFATSRVTVDLGTATVSSYGDARMTGGTWVLADGVSERGGVYIPPVQLGYGVLDVSASVRSTANVGTSCSGFLCVYPSGWLGVVVLSATAASFVGGSDLLPLNENGIALTWSLSNFLAFGADAAWLSELDGTGTGRTIATGEPLIGQDGPAGTVVTHLMSLVLTPDDPSTPVDEFSVTAGGFGFELTCANDGAMPCGFHAAAGDTIHLGVLGASDSGRSVSFDNPALVARVGGLCAP